MRIFIVRHGNTFGPDQAGGEHIFMCGSQNNIPLVQKGREQARIMAQYLSDHDLIPTALYANHLIRVWEHAVLIREYFYEHRSIDIPIYLDERLTELDYGNWAGVMTKGHSSLDNEVIAKFGQKAWDNWQNKRIIPNEAPHNWKITREKILDNIKSFFDMLTVHHQINDVIVAMGGQGSLSFVNELFEGGMELAISENRFKIKIGHFSEIAYDGNEFRLISWNQDPYEKLSSEFYQ